MLATGWEALLFAKVLPESQTRRIAQRAVEGRGSVQLGLIARARIARHVSSNRPIATGGKTMAFT